MLSQRPPAGKSEPGGGREAQSSHPAKRLRVHNPPSRPPEQHLLDRAVEVVVADLVDRYPAQAGEPVDVAFQERLLALGRCAAHPENDSRMVNSAVVVFTPASTTHRSWKSTSASVPGRYVWGTNPCFQRPTRLRRDLRATFPNVVAHRRIRQAVRVMLIDQTCQNLSRGGALLFRDIQIRPQHLIDGAPVVDDPTESQRAQSDWRARYPARPVVTDWPATCAIVTRSIASSPLQPRCSRRSGCGKRVGEDVRKLPTAAHPAGSKWRQLHHVQPGLSTTVERVSEPRGRGGTTPRCTRSAAPWCAASRTTIRCWRGPISTGR